jgi:hypothetical protein
MLTSSSHSHPPLTITTTTPSRRVRRWISAKHLNASAVLRVRHADVVHVHVCDDVSLASVLAKRADRDAVGAVALHVRDDHVCGVGLEGHAVIV